MKIKELKEYLNTLPAEMDDADIISMLSIGCCGETLDLGEVDVDHQLPSGKYSGVLTLRFNESIPGYRSCRQVGQTESNDKAYWSQFPASPH